MILGDLAFWDSHRPFEHPIIAEAIEELKNIVRTKPEAGRIELRGDMLYINIMEFESKSMEEQVAEKHELYLDIHLLIEGKESIGWTPAREGYEPTKPYDHEADYALFAPAEDEVLLPLKPGMYAVFYPHDIHRPSMGDGSVIRKAVVKIHVDLLK